MPFDEAHLGGLAASHTEINRILQTKTHNIGDNATIMQLQGQVEKLNLLVQTLLILLLEKKVITDAEFKQWVEYVDGLDGRVDGKVTPQKQPATCPDCGRANRVDAASCMYCGAKIDADYLHRRPK